MRSARRIEPSRAPAMRASRDIPKRLPSPLRCLLRWTLPEDGDRSDDRVLADEQGKGGRLDRASHAVAADDPEREMRRSSLAERDAEREILERDGAALIVSGRPLRCPSAGPELSGLGVRPAQ